jgi:hypothetical protein
MIVNSFLIFYFFVEFSHKIADNVWQIGDGAAFSTNAE